MLAQSSSSLGTGVGTTLGGAVLHKLSAGCPGRAGPGAPALRRTSLGLRAAVQYGEQPAGAAAVRQLPRTLHAAARILDGRRRAVRGRA